jgi:hypothetical protein
MREYAAGRPCVPINTALPGWADHASFLLDACFVGVERGVNAALGGTKFVFFFFAC